MIRIWHHNIIPERIRGYLGCARLWLVFGVDYPNLNWNIPIRATVGSFKFIVYGVCFFMYLPLPFQSHDIIHTPRVNREHVCGARVW